MASRIYRVARWIVLVLLVGSIALVFRKAPAPPVETNPAAKESLRKKWAEEQQASDSKKPHEMTMNEAELNSLLVSALQSAAQSPVRDVKINLLEDRARAYVLFALHGVDLSLVLEGQVGVRNGHLHFTPSAGKLGSLPLPQIALANAVTRLFEAPNNQESLRVSPQIADIRVEHYQLVVSYR